MSTVSRYKIKDHKDSICFSQHNFISIVCLLLDIKCHAINFPYTTNLSIATSKTISQPRASFSF